jgi:GTPase
MNDEVKKETNMRCGFVAMVGRPNVGKSTLLNSILGQKLSIVTSKPQTTRNRILAVHNHGATQVVFLDTPGIHQPQGSLGEYMVDTAQSAITESDVCVWLVDVTNSIRPAGLTRAEMEIAAALTASKKPIIVLLNKIDRLSNKPDLFPILEAASKIEGVLEVIPISALTEDGVETFMNMLVELLPEAPHLYPEDMLSEKAERFFIAEMIREALIDLTRQELPYHTAVVIDRFVEETKRCTIFATIHVERASQRGIVIGKGGSMIKTIGERARLASAEFLGCPVDLNLHVDVSRGWTKNKNKLKEMGYE